MPGLVLVSEEVPGVANNRDTDKTARTEESDTMAVELGQVYKCEKCGIIVEVVHAGKGAVVCCGAPMTQLAENTTDAAREKHVPVVTAEGSGTKVAVGSVAHPMTEEHYIEWIYLETTNGGQRKALKPGEAPKATFTLTDGKPVSAYAYCNLHGLWRKMI